MIPHILRDDSCLELFCKHHIWPSTYSLYSWFHSENDITNLRHMTLRGSDRKVYYQWQRANKTLIACTCVVSCPSTHLQEVPRVFDMITFVLMDFSLQTSSLAVTPLGHRQSVNVKNDFFVGTWKLSPWKVYHYKLYKGILLNILYSTKLLFRSFWNWLN